MMATQTGKLLYISDNAAEYLGHSMEDLLIHGDSVYDIIDKQDHASIQAQLSSNVPNGDCPSPPGGANASSESNNLNREKRIFLCRMNVSRNSRRQMRFGDQKVVLIEGRFSGVLPLCSRAEPVFVSWCTPVAMPETRESVVQGATNIYTSTHHMDLKFVSVDDNGQHYLGCDKKSLKGTSLYDTLHPESIKEVQAKHRLITQSENERSCILLVQQQRKDDGSYFWCHLVMQVKDSTTDQQSNSYIVCTNQILSPKEAEVMRANSWLYHYYMVQSRLQYNLAYGHTQPGGASGAAGAAAAAAAAHGASSLAAAIYGPQMMHMLPFGFDSAAQHGIGFDHFANGDLYHPPDSAYNGFPTYGEHNTSALSSSPPPPPPTSGSARGERSGSASPQPISFAAAAESFNGTAATAAEDYYSESANYGNRRSSPAKRTSSDSRKREKSSEDDNNNSKKHNNSSSSSSSKGPKSRKS